MANAREEESEIERGWEKKRARIYEFMRGRSVR